MMIFFAFPYYEGELSSSEWKDGLIALKDLKAENPIQLSDINEITNDTDRNKILLKKAIHKIKALLSYANVDLNPNFETEYSHHYGIENFEKIGTVLITVFNKIYAKKLLSAGWTITPSHYHKIKEETFYVLWGDLEVNLNGKEFYLSPGDHLDIKPGVWHSFKSKNGCVFEEISTEAFKNDSFYHDEKLILKKRRKKNSS